MRTPRRGHSRTGEITARPTAGRRRRRRIHALDRSALRASMSAASAQGHEHADDYLAATASAPTPHSEPDRRDRTAIVCRHVPVFPELLDLDGRPGVYIQDLCGRAAAFAAQGIGEALLRDVAAADAREGGVYLRLAVDVDNRRRAGLLRRLGIVHSRRRPDPRRLWRRVPGAGDGDGWQRGGRHEGLLRRGAEAPRSEGVPVERRAAAQPGKAGAGRAPACRRASRRLHDRAAAELRAGADRRRPHAGISRFPAAHLRALAAHRGRVGRGDPQHPPDRARRRLSGVRRRPGRLPHGRHRLPDLGRDLRQRLLERLDARSTRRMRCWRAQPCRLRALPAARPPRLRRCRRRLLLPQQFGDRRAAPAQRAPRASRSSTSTCITATARKASSTRAPTC